MRHNDTARVATHTAGTPDDRTCMRAQLMTTRAPATELEVQNTTGQLTKRQDIRKRCECETKDQGRVGTRREVGEKDAKLRGELAGE